MKSVWKVLLLVSLAPGALAEEIVLPEKLNVGWIDSPDVLSEMAYCLPDITDEKVADIQNRSKKAAVVYYPRRSERVPYLLAAGDRFACIGRNGNGKPILPPRFFKKIIKLEGASDKTVDSLYRSLALQLATRGAADALVRFSNGNAMEISLNVVDDTPTDIMYSANFLKSDQVDESKYRFAVTDDIKSVSTTSYGSSGRRAVAILQDEIAPRPMKGEHLWVKGSKSTAAYAFGGSTWRFGSGGSIYFGPGGNLTFNPQKGEPTQGAWHVEEDALYFNYGKVYGSAILEGEGALLVDFRSVIERLGIGERRWTAKLEKGQSGGIGSFPF